MEQFLTEIKQLFGWLQTEIFKVGETSITYGSIFRVILILVVTYIFFALVTKMPSDALPAIANPWRNHRYMRSHA